MIETYKIWAINGSAITFSFLPTVEADSFIQVLRIIALLVAISYSGW